MSYIEEYQTTRAQQMQDLEKAEEWTRLELLARSLTTNEFPKWFLAACYLQAATIEIAGQRYPDDPAVQAAVEANRRVLQLADELGL